MTETGSRTGHKREEVVVQRPHPFNAETPAGLLRGSFLTPTDLFYVRSHGAVPAVDLRSYKLSVSGLAQRPLELGFERLREEFPRREMTATLFCAGNRRKELMRVTPMPGKVPWGCGATGTARWAGLLPGDVLRAAGVGPGARSVKWLSGIELREAPTARRSRKSGSFSPKRTASRANTRRAVRGP